MDHSERMALRPVLWQVLFDHTGNAFETLFHDVMALCVPGFVDVRTHGNLGDQGSDGLSMHDGKLYACYSPETPNASKTIAKLHSDVTSALAQRAGGSLHLGVLDHAAVGRVHLPRGIVDRDRVRPGMAGVVVGVAPLDGRGLRHDRGRSSP